MFGVLLVCLALMPGVHSKVADVAPVIGTRAEFFNWPTHYNDYAKSQPWPLAYDRLSRRLARISLSTCFA